jgi:hypothetical protein
VLIVTQKRTVPAWYDIVLTVCLTVVSISVGIFTMYLRYRAIDWKISYQERTPAVIYETIWKTDLAYLALLILQEIDLNLLPGIERTRSEIRRAVINFFAFCGVMLLWVLLFGS